MNIIINTGNLGQMLMLFCVQYLFWVVLMTLLLKLKPTNALYKKRQSKVSSLKWGPLLGFCFRGFIPLCIATNLNLRYPLFTTWGEILAFIWAVFLSAVIYVWFPFKMLKVINSDESTRMNPEFKKMYGFLYNNIRNDTKGQRMFFLLFVLRRFALIMTAIELVHHPAIQVIILLLINLFFLIFTA